MRLAPGLFLLLGMSAAALSAATIQYQVTPLGSPGSGEYRYQYTVSDYSFSMNQELAIQFDLGLYSNLTNGVAPAGFDVLLFQPNFPPGTDGEYSAFTAVNQPSLSGQFSVDFMYLGVGLPGSQSFSINQYSDMGVPLGSKASGTTQPLVITATPEPAAFGLAGIGLLIAMIYLHLNSKTKTKI